MEIISLKVYAIIRKKNNTPCEHDKNWKYAYKQEILVKKKYLIVLLLNQNIRKKYRLNKK